MTPWLTAICAAIFSASVCGTQIDSQQVSAQGGPQEATQEERGTDKIPLVIKVLPTEKSNDDLARENEKHESDQKLVKFTSDLADYTLALFIATCVLVLVTAGLVVVGFFQVRGAKESIAASKLSAGAAAKSAAVAEAALTADLRADLRLGYRFSNEQDPKIVEYEFAIIVKNIGKHNADITAAAAGLSDNIDGDFTVYAGSEQHKSTTVCEPRQVFALLTLREGECNGKFCHGYVRWDDGIGRWERRFCVQIRTHPNRAVGELFFTVAGGDTWNHVVEAA